MHGIVKLLVVTTVLFFGLSACKTKQLKEQPLKEASRSATFTHLTATTNYLVNSAEVKDSILYLNVTYPAGCAPKGFDLVADGKMAKSMPPQINTNLLYAAGGTANCGGKKR
ncbi:MAG: hypothetical protein M0D57_09485 [Sphingobacteriales bacterium JAD_PAG50586_3]|nr:MAG: hypothetical protein M0D57_09485 [Sphingobacteriales bacterium JAD_PAG50586_3]